VGALSNDFGDPNRIFFSRRFVIRAGTATVGAIAMQRNWLFGPYVKFLGVVPAFQKAGIGNQVMNWFEAAARADGARNAWIAASEFNSTALQFYERLGFQRVATLDQLICDDISEVLMRKRLCAKI
jgi:diamine N-acetyltransferase